MRPAGIGLTAPRARRSRYVPPLLATAVVLLVAGLWEGLVYLGFGLPAGGTSLHEGHGPLMVLGFLGTLIALERSVALGTAWPYAAPAAAALGGLAIVLGVPGRLGPALLTLAGLLLAAIYGAIHRIQPALHNAVLCAGAVCWIVAAAVWLSGWDVPRFVPWLAGFLVLTITGERLELSRVAGTTRRARRLFTTSAAVFAVGLTVSLFAETTGVRIAGAGLIALTGWLARYDIARRTIRTRGLTRYIAAALLCGYAWLAIAGGLWLGVGRMSDGPAYDAMLHAIFLGFVISMIFAHAPVIVPAVLGRAFPYRPTLYAPLVLLHGTLALRLIADAADSHAVWQWAGTLNEAALLLFIAIAVQTMVLARGAGRF